MSVRCSDATETSNDSDLTKMKLGIGSARMMVQISCDRLMVAQSSKETV